MWSSAHLVEEALYTLSQAIFSTEFSQDILYQERSAKQDSGGTTWDHAALSLLHRLLLVLAGVALFQALVQGLAGDAKQLRRFVLIVLS